MSAYDPGPKKGDRPGCFGSVAAVVVAILLSVIVSTTALAQSATPLGRWVNSQPTSIKRNIGCNAPLPYPTVCWRTFVSGGQVTHTVYFRQTGSGIITSVVRP